MRVTFIIPQTQSLLPVGSITSVKAIDKVHSIIRGTGVVLVWEPDTPAVLNGSVQIRDSRATRAN